MVANIYGDGVSSKRARRLIRRLGVGHRITKHGGVPQQDVLEAMKGHHVFVSTSHDFDNQPMVILEAVSSGLPVVVCDPDLAEGLPAGGFLVTDSPQPHQLTATLGSLAADSTRIAAMSKAIAVSSSQVAFGTHSADLLDIYRLAMAAKSVR